jgi:hypothetical protein
MEGAVMCLLFYVAGCLTGYLAWRMSSAPMLWDAEDEAKHWKKQWLALKSEMDRNLVED